MTFAGSAYTQAWLEPRSAIGLTDAEMMLLPYHCRLSDTPKGQTCGNFTSVG